jgi:hypothetical protein
MEKDNKDHDQPEDLETIVETPIFPSFKEWWHAKKESLDLWGFEKYLGCDSTKFKAALATYKSLLQEIEHEYKHTVSEHGITEEQIEEAKKQRESMLLDAKRDFVYEMPEHYRIWFKKKKIFRSWRNTPENWGFEEARYWGSRSGLTMRERRLILAVLVLSAVGIAFLIIKVAGTDRKTALEGGSASREFKIERDTMGDVDSLMQAKMLRDRKAAEEKRAKKAFLERKNKIITDMNTGSYTTQGTDMRGEVAFLMQLYNENIYHTYLTQEQYMNDLEVLGTTLVLIEKRNPGLVTKLGDFRLPLLWKADTTIKVSWDDFEAGLQILRSRSQKQPAE